VNGHRQQHYHNSLYLNEWLYTASTKRNELVGGDMTKHTEPNSGPLQTKQLHTISFYWYCDNQMFTKLIFTSESDYDEISITVTPLDSQG
jgi:hypothetical protein